MLTQQPLEKMHGMKLSAMAEAFEQQLGSGAHTTLSFEERVGLLVDCEWTAREQRKLTRRLRAATPRYPAASLENVDFRHPRGLHRQQVLSLGSCRWIQDQHNLLITGPTGIGKSFLACAFVDGPAGAVSPPATFACRAYCTRWPLVAATDPTPGC